jgi:hypothetical protein
MLDAPGDGVVRRMSHTRDMSRPPYVNGDEGRGRVAVRPWLVEMDCALLGGLDEAEDVVQDAWLRPGRADPSEIGGVIGRPMVSAPWLALDVPCSIQVRERCISGRDSLSR